MKKMKKALSVLLTAVMTVSFTALPAMADSHPLMYKVTDSEGHSIYMLGTLHIIGNDTLPIEGIDTVLDSVDKVYFEVGEAEMEKLADPEQVQEMAEETLQSENVEVEDNGISEETEDLLEQTIKKYTGAEEIDRDALHEISINYLVQMVQSMAMASVQDQVSSAGVDVYVYELAKERGLEILGVEDVENQLDMYNNDMEAKMTDGAEGEEGDANAEKNLVELLQTLDEAPVQLLEMIRAYNEGDEEVLKEMLINEETRAESDSARNAQFLETAEQALKDGGNALITIGLYHLIADDGLVNTLSEAGYTVEQI